MKDSFFTTNPPPDPVVGSIDSMGIYEAGYLVRNAATGETASGTWYRFDQSPLRCLGPRRGLDCLPALGLQGFLDATIFRPNAALRMGEALSTMLFDVGASNSNYLDVERYIHLLSHPWGEDGGWNTPSAPAGVYEVSVLASDQAGNRASLSRFVTVNNSGCPADASTITPDAFVRDWEGDVGQMPSNLGNEPFWSSPDILVVPAGAAVAVDSSPGEVRVAAGASYDVYVRIHNERCVPVQGVRARVFSVDPSLVLDERDFVWITPPGQFVGDGAHPGGIDLAAGAVALLGPLRWTPSTEEASVYGGHRTIVALVDAATDPVRPGAVDVPGDDNVAERSLQASDAAFSIANPANADADIGIEFRANGFPATQGVAELRVEAHPALFPWLGASRAEVSWSGGKLVVRFRGGRVALPPARLPPSLALPATLNLTLPAGVTGPFTVDLVQSVGAQVRGGMSFTVSG